MPINNPTPAIKPPRPGQPYGEAQPLDEDDPNASTSQAAPVPDGTPNTWLQGGPMADQTAQTTQPQPQPPAPGGGGSAVASDLMMASGAASPGGTPAAPPINVNAPSLAMQTGQAQDSLEGRINQSALDYLNNPSRFDIPLVQQATGLIDAELADQRERAVANLDEFNASRGRTGSSFEAQERGELESDLERQRMQRLFDLNMAVANTYGADRAGALGAAGDVLQGERDFGLGSRALDIDEDRLVAENEQFRAQLNQRESEFARSLGLEREQFRAEQAQFAAQMREQIAGRLQQESQFARSLESEEAQAAMDNALRKRALDLQKQGMDLDEAFRRAELDLETGIRQRALDLEEEGMGLDEAYRRAALESENWRIQQELNLQARSIGDTARLSQLDIILRALSSGLDADEIGQYIGDYTAPSDPNVQPYPGGGGGRKPFTYGTSGGQIDPALLQQLRDAGII